MSNHIRLLALAVLAAAGVAAVLLLPGDGGPAPLVAQEDARGPPAPVPVAAAVSPWKAPEQVPEANFLYTRFETIGVEDGLPSARVTSVFAEGDLLAVGTEHGLAVRNAPDQPFVVYGEEQGLSHAYVTSVTRDADTDALWISTLSGLNRLSGGKIKVYTQTDSGLMNDVVYHVLVQDGLVWAATAAGVSVLDQRSGSWALYDTGNSIIHEPWCYAMALGPGRAWVGIWGGGIDELDLQTHTWREYRDPDGEMEIDLLRDDGPLHDVSSFIAYDAGVLWQATYFGLARYDGRRWDSYVAADTGLPGDFIHHVHARGHTVWISTDQGFGVFDGKTCVSFRRREDGRADRTVWRDGKEVERTVLDTAPGSNYVLWSQGDDRGAWLATAAGLCRAILEPEDSGKPTGGDK